MNIYCVIFMCTFGSSNSTDTEMPRSNSLLKSTGPRVLINETDVASMILPEKGMPVPQYRDIVMDLPRVHDSAKANQATSKPAVKSTTQRGTHAATGPSLSDILLPPAPLRNRLTSQS